MQSLDNLSDLERLPFLGFDSLRLLRRLTRTNLTTDLSVMHGQSDINIQDYFLFWNNYSPSGFVLQISRKICKTKFDTNLEPRASFFRLQFTL